MCITKYLGITKNVNKMKPENYNEVDIYEIEDFIGNEVCIVLRNGTLYFGILKDADDEELILSRPNGKFSLGFQLSWVNNAFVKEEKEDSE